MRYASILVLSFLVIAASLFSMYYEIGTTGKFTVIDHDQQEEQGKALLIIQEKKLSSKTYYYGAGLVASEESDVVEYYHQDYLGSVRAQTNTNKNKVSASRSAPFGEDVYESGLASAGSTYKFTGQERDETLYYYGARYYAPQSARFTQLDPVLDTASPYRYTDNNPLKFVDPTGEKIVFREGTAETIKQKYGLDIEDILESSQTLRDINSLQEVVEVGYASESELDLLKSMGNPIAIQTSLKGRFVSRIVPTITDASSIILLNQNANPLFQSKDASMTIAQLIHEATHALGTFISETPFHKMNYKGNKILTALEEMRTGKSTVAELQILQKNPKFKNIDLKTAILIQSESYVEQRDTVMYLASLQTVNNENFVEILKYFNLYNDENMVKAALADTVFKRGEWQIQGEQEFIKRAKNTK